MSSVNAPSHDPAVSRERRGAVLLLIAVTLVGMMAVLALAIDGGSLQRQRRLAQNAADAGAQGGATEILRSRTDTSTIFGAARAEATRNGFTTGTNGVRVVVTTPESPDYYAGASYVKVVVEDTVRTLFAGMIGKPLAVIRAQAFGGINPPSFDCLITLEPTDRQSLRVDAGANFQAPNCGIRVNSNAIGVGNQNALYVSGATLNAAGASIRVFGGAAGTTTPTAQTGVPAILDPLAYLTMPSFAHTCTYTNKTVSTVGTTVLGPGTYCGGLTVQNNGVVAQLTEGDYYLLGGGLNVKSGGRMFSTGAGVTFINTYDATHAYARVNLQSGAIINLSANTRNDAALPGILIYQDPTVTGSAGLLAGNANQIQSGAGSTFTGSIYFRTQDLEIHSGATLTMVGGIVAREVWVHDNTTVNLTGAGGGNSEYFKLRRASVVE